MGFACAASHHPQAAGFVFDVPHEVQVAIGVFFLGLLVVSVASSLFDAIRHEGSSPGNQNSNP